MKRLAPIVAGFVLTACAAQPQIVTKEVRIAVPVRCAPTIAPPPGRILTRNEIAAALVKAANVTERARIVSDQLLLWLGYGPRIEAGLKSCKGSE